MLSLSAGDYELSIDPACGGAITLFNWRGEPVLRRAVGPGVLDSASFPLVPFSNRIAHGVFTAHDVPVHVQPNFPGSDHPHPLHGFGWLSAWDVVAHDAAYAHITHSYSNPAWPWPYIASQHFTLGDNGLTIELSIRHEGATAMPCGLGLHPQFPCNDHTILRTLHHAEVLVDSECLPVGTRQSDSAFDFWEGQPATSRQVDTGYLNRVGPIVIQWPDRSMEVVVTPSDQLQHTVVYTPDNADYFCVEPVSHRTNSFNAQHDAGGDHIMLAPHEDYSVTCHFHARTLA